MVVCSLCILCTSSDLLNVVSIFICEDVLPAGVSVHHMHAMPEESGRGCWHALGLPGCVGVSEN